MSQYQKHIKKLCAEHNIVLVQKPGTPGMMFVEEEPSRIECPTITNQSEYITNLHEIGHCVRGHTQGRPPYQDKKFYFINGVLKSEAEAWEYALDNSIDEWSEASRRFAWDTCLGSYYVGYLHAAGSANNRLLNGNRHHVPFRYDHPNEYFEKIMKRIQGNIKNFYIPYIGRWYNNVSRYSI